MSWDGLHREEVEELYRDMAAGDRRLKGTAEGAEMVADALLAQIDQELAARSRIQAAADALVASGVVPKRVIIEVDGGVARVSYVSPGVEVQIIDHDDEESGPPVIEQPAWCAHGVSHDRPCERCSL